MDASSVLTTRLTRTHGSNTAAIGTWRNTVLSLWRATPAAAEAEALRATMATARAAYPSGVGLVIIAQLPASPPGEDARNAFIQMTRESQETLRAAVVVAEGQGFGAAVVRSVTTGVVLLSRSKVPTKVFAETPEAATWLIDEMGRASASPGTADDLRAALAELRAIRA